MSIQLAQRVLSINESQTLGMAKLGRELKAKGFDVINLSLGEPDFDTPQHIKEAAKLAIDEGYTKYTPVVGYLDLREAISRKFKTDNNLDIPPDRIIVSTGAKQSIMDVVLSLVNPGDEAIIPSPYWVSYSSMVEYAQGKAVEVFAGVEQDFKPTVAQLEAAITPKTKLMIFSSPCNPTGSVFTKAELAAIAQLLEKHPNIYIISDEIYEHINYIGRHESLAQFESLKDRMIVVNGVSKAFAMTGWRIGYIGAPKFIVEACEKLQGQFTSGTCSVSQRAALAALTTSLEPTYKMREQFKKRRDLVLDLMKDIPGFKCNVPQGAFYVFPDVSYYFGKSNGSTTIKDATDLTMYILDKAHVVTVTGEAFGSPNNIRLSYAASEDNLTQGFKRIQQALSELR